MSRYPGAEWKPLPENAYQPAITPTQFILHTAVDHPGPSNIPGYFGREDITVESHFWIYLDGRVIQMMDTNVRADANLKGNVRAISVETEDEGNPVGIPWTPAQLQSLIDLIRWAAEEHDIPLEVMPEWDAPGLGWHAMWGFVDNRRQTGLIRSPWTPSLGKTCPGKTRIDQFHDVILPALQTPKVGGSLSISNPQEETEMSTPVLEWFRFIATADGNNYSAAVELWQRLLNGWGADLTVDGLVGPATEKAHIQWTKSVESGSNAPRPGRFQWRRLLNEVSRPQDAGVDPGVVDALKTEIFRLQNDLDKADTKIDTALEALSG